MSSSILRQLSCFRNVILALVFLVLGLTIQVGAAEKRVALVAANSDYSDAGRLSDPANDAEGMVKALRRSGFEVITATNFSRQEFDEILHNFTVALEGAEVGLFYYSGHSIHINAQDRIVPVDASLNDSGDLEPQTINVDDIILEMGLRVSKEKSRIVILDACRHNSFQGRSYQSGSDNALYQTEPGCAKRSAEMGVLVILSAETAQEAYESPGTYSYFTEALLNWAFTPGMEIHLALIQVYEELKLKTDGGQVMSHVSGLISSVYLGGQKSEVKDASLTDSQATPPAEIPGPGAERPTTCDLLAGHPSDPRGVGPGVSYDLLQPGPAIEACQSALAADPENPRFMALLARALEKAGRYAEAIGLNERAMQKGYLAAYHNLGNHYKKGAGVERNIRKALEYFIHAAERGHHEDEYNVGVIYMQGEDDIPQNLDAAHHWLRIAAEANYPSAFDKLGILYSTGKGVPIDLVEAARLFAKGADFGDASAMVNLANAYTKGLGVAADLSKAHLFFRSAALLGRTSAFVNLGRIFSEGRGVEANPVQAAFWFRLAARAGDEYSLKTVQKLQSKLSEEQKQEIEEMIERWDDDKFG